MSLPLKKCLLMGYQNVKPILFFLWLLIVLCIRMSFYKYPYSSKYGYQNEYESNYLYLFTSLGFSFLVILGFRDFNKHTQR